MSLDVLSLRDCKCVRISLWLSCFHRTFSLCSLNLLQAPYSTHIYLSILYICVFFLKDKKGFEFVDVMSIVYTHIISMFCLVFISFKIQISILMPHFCDYVNFGEKKTKRSLNGTKEDQEHHTQQAFDLLIFLC